MACPWFTCSAQFRFFDAEMSCRFCWCEYLLFCFFFFSSRRRHTRWPRDWSSDVCSSDLNIFKLKLEYFRPLGNPNKFLQGLLQHFNRLKDEDISPIQYLEWVQGKSKKLKVESEEEIEEQRSEERRVGKECRYRWWQKHYK